MYLFLDIRKGRRQSDISVWMLLEHLLLWTWPATQVCALGWECNQWVFDSQASSQSTESHQPRLINNFLNNLKLQFTYYYNHFRCMKYWLDIYIIYTVITCINLFYSIHLTTHTVITMLISIFPCHILYHHGYIVTTKLCFSPLLAVKRGLRLKDTAPY